MKPDQHAHLEADVLDEVVVERRGPSSTALTIVAKLSSVRIITAASLETSVPVMPIAMPMSACLSAGASLTPSPVIADDVALALEDVDEADLVLGRDAGDDADVVDLARRPASSLIAANSAPVIARPSMPSWRAIASAVTAWSPVIIRTWMPAACARGDRGLGRRPRRVDDADQREQRQPVHQRQQVGVRVEASPGRSPCARWPSRAGPARRAARSRRGSASVKSSSTGAARSVGSRCDDGAGEQLVGRALDEAADDLAARLVGHAVERGHQLVGGVERQLGDARVALAGRRRGRRRPSRRARPARPRSGRRSSRRRVTTASRPAPSAAGTARAATSGSPPTCVIWPSVE